MDDDEQQAIIRSRTNVGGSVIKARPQSGLKVRTGSKQRRNSSINQTATETPKAATSIKDPRLAVVASILDKKKINIDKGHVPVIGGSAAPNTTGEKKQFVGMGEMKRVVLQGSSAAPIKPKMMTVKLKSSQIQFKSTETKVIKKE
mmetsp:Transcript_5638/g.7528  ORF Transcript_5638/g.7528 Transcript_5638/m.7528 type:complete len:146 (+) Transcript_5638:2306-2743(+)